MPADTKMSPKQAEMMHKSMDSKAAMGMTMMDLPKPAVMEYMLTKGMNEPDQGTPPSLVIPLNHKDTVTAHRTGITKTADGYIWRGIIDGSGEPVTLLWWPDGRVAGTVTHAGRMYVIKTFRGEHARHARAGARQAAARPRAGKPEDDGKDEHAHRPAWCIRARRS